MAAPPDLIEKPGNQVLALLDTATREALAADLEYVPLKLRDEVQHEGKPIRHVHFPTSCVVSMLAAAAGTGRKIEVGTLESHIGRVLDVQEKCLQLATTPRTT